MSERKCAMKPNSTYTHYYRRTRRITLVRSIICSILFDCSFPHLFCSSIVIETLMNILNILSYSLNEDNLHKVTAHHRVPDTNYTIQFVDTHEKRLVSVFFCPSRDSLDESFRDICLGTFQCLRGFRSHVHRASIDDVPDPTEVLHSGEHHTSIHEIDNQRDCFVLLAIHAQAWTRKEDIQCCSTA